MKWYQYDVETVWLIFVFSSSIAIIIRLKDTKADWRWQLQPSGRFAHNKDYVISVGKDHSLQTVHYEAMDGFRKEGQTDVRGHIFIMQKQSSKSQQELWLWFMRNVDTKSIFICMNMYASTSTYVIYIHNAIKLGQDDLLL